MSEITVSKNSKSLLARLLAEENIRVEHSAEVTTASFNLESRLLLLPIWKDDIYTPDLYDLFVGHEVGHALFTPSDLTLLVEAQSRSNHAFLNVVEDARIEKLMKRKFQGLQAPFKNAYSELHEKDFFGLEGEHIKSRNLIDRINLFFKLRYALNLYAPSLFNAKEMEFIRRIDAVETYGEVANICEDLYKYLSDEQQNRHQENSSHDEPDRLDEVTAESSDAMSSEPLMPLTDHSEDFDGESGQLAKTDQSSISEEYEEAEDASDKTLADGVPDEFSSKTSHSLAENMEGMVSAARSSVVYVTLNDKYSLNDYVHDYKEVQSDFETQLTSLVNSSEDHSFGEMMSLKELMNDNAKTISYLVKEFEMKKAARAHSLSSESKTGTINSSKLWSYQVNDDVFLRKANSPEGKNHGMIMVVDWSGSMASTIVNTVKQAVILASFCRRVGINFEVYNFTSVNRKISEAIDYSYLSDGDVALGDIALRNTLSSRMNSREFSQSCQNYLNVAASISGKIGRYIRYSQIESAFEQDKFGSTPTNNALILLDRIIPKFKKESSLEKVNLVLLTDGEPTDTIEFRNSKSTSTRLSVETTRYYSKVFLRDSSTNETYDLTSKSSSYGLSGLSASKSLIKILREKHGINSIGFYLLTKQARSEVRRVISAFVDSELDPSAKKYQDLRKQFNKNNFFVATNSGHNEYYIINAKIDPKTDELKVDSTMSKSAIAKSFMNHSKSKLVNRQLLNKFVDLVK
jgi:hypothetical protein